MSSYLTVLAVPNPENQEEMRKYLSLVGPMLMGAGGKIIIKNKLTKIINGNSPVKMVLVVEYPSQETIEEIFNSEEYKSIIPLREKGFSNMEIFITEKMD